MKEIPKKSTIIQNLLNREDNYFLSIKPTKVGILLSWEKNTVVHYKATKEVLSLLNKNDLYKLLIGVETNKILEFNIPISSFKLIKNIPNS